MLCGIKIKEPRYSGSWIYTPQTGHWGMLTKPCKLAITICDIVISISVGAFIVKIGAAARSADVFQVCSVLMGFRM